MAINFPGAFPTMIPVRMCEWVLSRYDENERCRVTIHVGSETEKRRVVQQGFNVRGGPFVHTYDCRCDFCNGAAYKIYYEKE